MVVQAVKVEVAPVAHGAQILVAIVAGSVIQMPDVDLYADDPSRLGAI